MNDQIFKLLWWIVVIANLLGVIMEITLWLFILNGMAIERRPSVAYVLSALTVVTILIIERRKRERLRKSGESAIPPQKKRFFK